ncbi:MAG: hypothetical protein K9J06_14460 [Flavobacteriales bacterium]|nr:hypothetical protein [Flavobacteriales bacterium]
MQRTVILLLLSFLVLGGASAQRRPVSVVHDASIFNYTITRYVPVWEVTPKEGEKEGFLSQHQKFFKESDPKGIAALKSMLFSRGMVPADVAKLDGEALESRLSKDRFTIYYRVEYGDHSIFLCHLNNSPVRSVIPFRIEGSKWILDPDFADTEFYGLLSSSSFDPYMGLVGGESVCAFGFEEVSGLTSILQDYSGKGNHAPRKSVSIVDGRFGGALKIYGTVATSVRLKQTMCASDGIVVDFHLQVLKMVYNTEKKRTVMTLGNDDAAIRVETVNGLLRLSYPVGSGTQFLEWPYTPEVWSLISIEILKDGVTVRENDVEVASSRIAPDPRFKANVLRLGAPNGVKANMDELRIAAK